MNTLSKLVSSLKALSPMCFKLLGKYTEDNLLQYDTASPAMLDTLSGSVKCVKLKQSYSAL